MDSKNWITKRNNSLMNNNQSNNYISNFHHEIDSLFDSFFHNFAFPSIRSNNNLSFSPNVDIVENDKEYQLILEVPGVNENDLKINLENNKLTVSGEKKQDNNSNNQNYHRSERFYGSFQRSFNLPEDSNLNNIDASFKNGILTISIARKAELKPIQRQINIRRSY
ncbi:Hsp20/alpha crystallin family protein [Rickettsiales bacterium LUAb2]